MALSKYRDQDSQTKIDLGGFDEHKLHLLPARKYDPAAGGDDGEGGIYSHLTEMCSGDWSWKPGRDKALGDNFLTYKPLGGASSAHDRFCKRCDAFYCECPRHVQFGIPPHMVNETAAQFQERARAVHSVA